MYTHIILVDPALIAFASKKLYVPIWWIVMRFGRDLSVYWPSVLDVIVLKREK